MRISIKKAMADTEVRREMEKDVLHTMIGIYCHGNHHTPKGQLCPDCEAFWEYARNRTEHCPFMKTKTFCSACKVHCYNGQWRPYARNVMRYSGPRMLLYHPVLGILHMYIMLRQKSKNRKAIG